MQNTPDMAELGATEVKRRKRIHRGSATEDLAVAHIMAALAKYGGHRLVITYPDYGRDALIQFNDAGSAKGYQAHVQIKGRAQLPRQSALFGFPMDAESLSYLSDISAPAFYLVHDAGAGETYFREVHEIVAELEATVPGWELLARVQVTLRREQILDESGTRSIFESARAWREERRSMKSDVEKLEAMLRKHTGCRIEGREEGDGAVLSGPISAVISTAQYGRVIGPYRLIHQLIHGASLCLAYRSRQQTAMPSHTCSVLSSLGDLTLSDLFEQLRSCAQMCESLDREHGAEIIGPSGREELDSGSDILPKRPGAPAPIPMNSIRTVDELRGALVERWVIMGLEPAANEDDGTVTAELLGTRLMINLEWFDVPLSVDAVRSVLKAGRRKEINVLGLLFRDPATAGPNLYRVRRSNDPRAVGVQVGTPWPTVAHVESELLRAIAHTSIPDTIAPQPSDSKLGPIYALHSPFAPKLPATVELQQVIVRRALNEIIKSLDARRPQCFVFMFPDSERIEVLTMAMPSHVLAFLGGGTEGLCAAGGVYSANEPRMKRRSKQRGCAGGSDGEAHRD